MRDYMTMVYHYLKTQKGQGMVEYALILALIVIVGMATMSGLGNKIAAEFTTVTNAIK